MERGYDEAYRCLLSLQSRGVLLEESASSRHLVLDMMTHYMDRLRLDLAALPPVVHVAGTKGKGSTCAFVESILRGHGLRTGLFTSPHLVHVRERFRLCGVPVDEATFLRYFWGCWDVLEATKDQAATVGFPPMPGFFRFLTLLAFQLFIGERVDAVVLEVGIGGRLDATNVVPSPVACGVSALDYDHMRVLGSTLAKIAREKAGIFKPGVACFAVPQPGHAAFRVMEEAAARQGVALTRIQGPLDSSVALGVQGTYQRWNASLAVALADAALRARGSDAAGALSDDGALTETTRQCLAACRWPGRAMETLVTAAGAGEGSDQEGGTGPLYRSVHPLVPHASSRLRAFVDGAHTPRSLRMCAQWFSEGSEARAAGGPRPRRVLLFNCGHERNAAELMWPLTLLGVDEVVLCPFDFERPSTVRRQGAQELLCTARMRGPELADARAHTDSMLRWHGGDADGAEGSGGDGAGPGSGASDVDVPAWQHTLAQVWDALRSRDRILALADSVPDAARGGAAAGGEEEEEEEEEVLLRFLADLPAPLWKGLARVRARVEPSARAAIEGLLRRLGEGEEVHLLVTGSLYLVGSAVDVLGVAG